MAELIRITQTAAGSVPLSTRDGVPVCAYCDETMVEIDENFWECPAGRVGLDAAIDALLELFENANIRPGRHVAGTQLRVASRGRASVARWRHRHRRPCPPC
jgi:hypothetical protein